MKKSFKTYFILWAICFVLFLVVSIFVPNAYPEKFSNGSFLSGFISIVVSFLVNLLCSLIALNQETNQKALYNLSLLRISYIGLFFATAFGIVFMFVPVIPSWVAIIISGIIVIGTIFNVVKAKTAVNIVSNVDEKIKNNTAFMNDCTLKAKVLYDNADSSIKEKCRTVYEAFKYSDPMTSSHTEEIEKQIAEELESFTQQVNNGSVNSDKLLKLLNTRNSIAITNK